MDLSKQISKPQKTYIVFTPIYYQIVKIAADFLEKFGGLLLISYFCPTNLLNVTDMKKNYLIIAMAVSALAVNAQQVLNLSTYNGTDLTKYDGQECKVNVNRHVFTAWNTLALPFAMSESELNDVFGTDCRLEKLVGAEEVNGKVTLFFQDCKAGGVEANVPYILYYTGENGNAKIAKNTLIENTEAVLSYNVKGSDDVVSMVGTKKHFNGIGAYGVLAADNSDAKFVPVDESLNGFYATRCYVSLESGNSKLLETQHLAAGEATSINNIVSNKTKVDVYTISGQKVATGINAAQVNNLQPGIYVVNGQKIVVK